MKNNKIIDKLSDIFKLITPDNYKYIKFNDENNSKYLLICDLLVSTWLDSFNDAKNIMADKDVKCEFYNDKQIINYLPLEYYDSFIVLYGQLCDGIILDFLGADFEEYEDLVTLIKNYLLILFRYSTIENIEIIIDNISIPPNIWMDIIDNGYRDIISKFDDYNKIIIAKSLSYNSDFTKYLNILNIPWFSTTLFNDSVANQTINNNVTKDELYLTGKDQYRVSYDNEIYQIIYMSGGFLSRGSRFKMQARYNNKSPIYGILFNKTKFIWNDSEYINGKLFKNKMIEPIIVNINDKKDLMKLIMTERDYDLFDIGSDTDYLI